VATQCEFVAQSPKDALAFNCSGTKHVFLAAQRRNTCFNSLDKLCFLFLFVCLFERDSCQLLCKCYV